MNIAKRVNALESRAHSGGYEYHRVIQHDGQSRDEALDAYGRDRLGPDGFAVLRVIVFAPGDNGDEDVTAE